MTQKEAVVKALKKLGGQSHLTEIYILAKAYIGDSSSAQQIEANIRRELNTNHALFCHVDGMPDGWWQLRSYQSELSKLKSLVEAQKKELSRLNAVITDEEVLNELVDVVEEMSESDIAAHERSIGRLNMAMEHRYEHYVKRLAMKSKERVEQKSGDLVQGNKTIIQAANYNAEVTEQNNNFPLPPVGGKEQKSIEE